MHLVSGRAVSSDSDVRRNSNNVATVCSLAFYSYARRIGCRMEKTARIWISQEAG